MFGTGKGGAEGFQLSGAPCRAEKEKTGARIEVFLLRELNAESRLWDVLVDPARKIRIGNKLFFGDDESLVAEVIDNTTSRGRTLRFLYDGSYEEFRAKLKELGETELRLSLMQSISVLQLRTGRHLQAVASMYAGVEKIKNPTLKQRFLKRLLGIPIQILNNQSENRADINRYRRKKSNYISDNLF